MSYLILLAQLAILRETEIMEYVAYGIFGFVGLLIVTRLVVEIPPVKRWYRSKFVRRR